MALPDNPRNSNHRNIDRRGVTRMPNIIVKVPEGVFDAEHRAALARGITAAAKAAERIGDDPRQEFLAWVVVEEVKAGCFFAGGHDPLGRVIPVMVVFNSPAGVLDDAARAVAVRMVHEAVCAAKPEADPRPVMTSVVMAEVADGHWGANGNVWRLADCARAAGYAHLRHLAQPAAAV